MAQGKLKSDIDLSVQDVSALSSPDALAAWFTHLGYDTAKRTVLTPESVGLQNQDGTFKHIELLSEDAEGFLRVVFARLRAVTAKARNDLVRVLGRLSQDHLLVLAKDFEVLEFVLIDKVKHHRPGPAAAAAYRPVPRTLTITRKAPSRLDLRILRRFTFTGRDGLEQFDKLRSTFEAAGYTGVYYQNRALFADHYLDTRLREGGAWRENPGGAFAAVQGIMADARRRFTGKDEAHAREHLYDPLFKALGFKASHAKKADEDSPTPDYVLKDTAGNVLTAALVYRWERWLDGSDGTDEQTPDENPGAAVVSILEHGDTEWVIVTNGRMWRLYSRQAHSRSTNFYEVDLEEALLASGETDPNEAFRYWWLFFRPQAFAPLPSPTPGAACWLDTVTAGSREYAKQVEGRLKKRVFEYIVPHLAAGFLADRKDRRGIKGQPTADELEEIRHGTLMLLYRLLFLLYAESRDLLPVRESPYFEVSLKKIKEQVGAAAGPAESAVDEKLGAAYSAKETGLYDRLSHLCGVMAEGDPALNVPTYNGGLFAGEPGDAASREARIARFLAAHKVPDLYLAQAIDHLSRDPDEAKGFEMVFIDYKSLGVRQLGSIYEGLLEFRLKVADEDLTTVTEKGREKVIPLAARQGRRRAEIAVRKGEPYLADDNSERKATGSYYTPDEIVKYIVANTVGPVLDEKLEALRPLIHEAEKTFQRHVANAKANPGLLPRGTDPRTFATEKTYTQHKDLVERLFDCRVLDPAMGSGHFLVEAVDRITDRLIVFLNRFPGNPVVTALEHTRQSILESLADQGVSVDPDKLTDVHLLKRHVLKRCIHGVDLNPMAVELAKVSLWLDAFTLGAPLSFLDHHLCCGNSLVGELRVSDHILPGSAREAAFLLAIMKMLEIIRSADATAADVKASTLMFEEVQKLESPFRRRLNVSTAVHFIDVGDPGAAGGFAFEKDFNPDKVSPLRQRSAKGYIAAQELAEERRFFHWPLEFPEVFFGVREGTERHIEERPPETSGFDAIVGNPPYVRQESLKVDKAWFKATYTNTYEATCDLYVYFMEREIGLLRAGGLMSMIVANKWLRAGYGRKLRAFLLRHAKPESIVDFGHSLIFPDADTFPCVPIFSRRAKPLVPDTAPPDDEVLHACLYPREAYVPDMPIGPYVMTRRENVPTTFLGQDGWSLENPEVQEVLAHRVGAGTSLNEYIGSPPSFGIKTGFNEAFYVDAHKRQELIKETPSCSEVIVPLLRGREIGRWAPKPHELFFIAIPSSQNRTWPWTGKGDKAEGVFARVFPSVHRHLSGYKQQLTDRTDQGDFWWELRSCDYYDQFAKPKLILQRIGYHSQIALDESGAYTNDSAIILPKGDLAVLAVLNSPVAWAFMFRTFPHKKDEALAMDAAAVGSYPMPSQLDLPAVGTLAKKLVILAQENGNWDIRTLLKVRNIVGCPSLDGRVLLWLRRHEDDFVRMVRAHGERRITVAAEAELKVFRQKASEELGDALTEQLKLEKQLAVLVEDAYGLTPEERALLRATRPVRDPIDVLEARLAGLDTGEHETAETDS